MSEPAIPPLDGSLPTLPDLADFQARHNGSLPWLIFPSKDKPEELCSISFAEMAEASHRVAHIVRPRRAGPEREVIGMILNTDSVLYIPLILGIMRAGYVPYPMSPRNSAQGVAHMLEATSCTRILAQASTMPLVQQVQAEVAPKGVTLRVDDLPSLYDVFPNLDSKQKNVPPVEPYPAAQEPVDVLKPCMYIHSSGSTGFPKSIHYTHKRMLQWAARYPLGSSPDVRFGAIGLPTFHAMGMSIQLVYPLALTQAVVVHPPMYPAPPVVVHPQSVYEVAKLCQCNALLVPPSFIEAWSHSQEAIEYLRTLKVLMYGGGPLSVPVGNRLVEAGVPLRNVYGGTEFGAPMLAWDKIPRSSTRPDPDWHWYWILDSPDIRWDLQGDGTYELVVVETEDHHVAVHNVPGEKAYATADLFERHPTKPNLWKIVGRKDDVITLSTGEKIVPIPQEGCINASPFVAGSVMFGREHEQPGILVEPAPGHVIDPTDEVALSQFRNKIWSKVEEANAAAPAFAKIFKEMILVTDPDRPLPRAGKGTIIRKSALAIYAEDIVKLYETVAQSANVQGISPPPSWSPADLEPWLLEQATSLVSPDHALSPTDDLFQHGFDSLSATFLRNRIIGVLRDAAAPGAKHAAAHISGNLIFEHPTVRELAAAVAAAVDPSSALSRADRARAQVRLLEDMVARYTRDMPGARAAQKARAQEGAPVVLITGSTGNIGSHILAYLLADKRVGKVYTLNRPSADPLGRLKAAFADRGLPVDALDNPKFVSLVGEVTKDKFGLDDAQYSEVVNSVTHIIHNAWTVNFNLALQSFEDQIAGVRRLVDISASSEHPVRILMTSSIGIATGWDMAKGPVPEHPLPDPAPVAGFGYAASKYVVEQMFAAARTKDIPATIVRMGQACGPKATGAWGTTEWMPILVKSSVALACLPGLTGPVDWVPLDAIAEAYIDWVVARNELPPLVNVVHPRPTSWEVILRGLREELGGTLPIVPLPEWAARLEARAASPSAEDLVNIPALKLLDFFRGLARPGAGDSEQAGAGAEGGVLGAVFETAALLKSSATMSALQPMTEEHARMWVRYWKAKGFIA